MERNQIQALDRTQPGLLLKPGKCGTMTHGYKSNGVTTLFAALNVRDGTVLGRCMAQHRHQEFVGGTRACFHDPSMNRTYGEVATHYGTAIVPARRYKPRDKAKVEVGVQVVQRWILARLRGRRFLSRHANG